MDPLQLPSHQTSHNKVNTYYHVCSGGCQATTCPESEHAPATGGLIPVPGATDVLELAGLIGFSSDHMARGPWRRRLLATRSGGAVDVLRHWRHDTATVPSC